MAYNEALEPISSQVQKGAITIKTVARKAGVSISTVSRVLNNPDSVTLDKRNRVNKAIEELNYVPNPVARALGSRKVGSIAIVVPTILNPFMSEVMRGVIEVLDEDSYDALVFDSNEQFEREKVFFEVLPHKMIDGAIFLGASGRELDFDILAEKMPVALVARSEEPMMVDTFTADEKQGMLRMVEHLYELGHRRIGHIGGSFGSSDAMRRFGFFKDALKELGIDWNSSFDLFCDWSLQGGYDGMLKLLQKKEQPTAVICATDLIAMGALGAANKAGIRVPEDLSVAGFDNAPSSPFLIPPLTTLKYPNYQIGRLAARSVLKKLHGRDEKRGKSIRKIIPMELIERDSTAKAPFVDKHTGN
jgi:DNA-binding LacI/PurR family transcriptional regulator